MKFVQIVILLLIAAVSGAQILAGAVVAPVIFNANSFLGGEFLSKAQSGVLMTSVFAKLSYAIFATALLAVLFELKAVLLKEKLSLKCLVLSLIWLGLAATFLFYFVDVINEAMQLQQTQNEQFEATHKSSEKLFAVLLVTQVIYFYFFCSRFKNA